MKKIFAIVFAIVLCLAMGVVTFAEETPIVKIGETEYTDIALAITEWNTNGGKLTLLEKVEGAPTVNIAEGKTAVLELNGKEMSFSGNTFKNYADLTIQDSSEGETGKISFSANGVIQEAGKLTITSGTVYAGGYTAVNIKAGEFKMTGGVVSGKGSGSIGALLLAEETDAEISAGSVVGRNGMVVKVSGELLVKGTAAIYKESSSNDVFRTVEGSKTTIEGGKISGVIDVYKSHIVITGGDFSEATLELRGSIDAKATVSDTVTSLPSEKVSSATEKLKLLSKNADGVTTYWLSIDPEKAAAKIGDIYYETTVKALAAVQDGEMLVLLKDMGSEAVAVTLTAPEKAFTLDLNGHTVIGGVKAVDGTDLTIIDSGETKGKLVSVLFSNKYSYGIEVQPGATVTVDKDVTIESTKNMAAIFVGEFKEESEKTATLNFYGKAVNTKEGFAISGNGTDVIGGTVINIYEGAEITSGSIAIYHPQNGTVNMYGGKIEGGTGIEMRAGVLNVTGGEIIGNGEFIQEENGNGATVIGVGIAVSQHTTNIDISVNVSGDAKVTGGKYALYEVDLQDEETENVDIKVEDGTFTATSEEEGAKAVSSENVEGFVSGGTFSTDPEEYIDPEAPVAVLDGGEENESSEYAVGKKSIKELSEKAEEEGSALEITKAGDGEIEVVPGVTVKNKTGEEIKVNGETVEDEEEVLAKNPNKKPRPEPCDHEFDENNVCKECGVKVTQYVDGKPVAKPEEETNPNTGAESAVSLAAAVAVVALAGAVISKRR